MNGPRDEKDTSYSESKDGSHHTWYDGDKGSHISWDTDKDGNYQKGSGHETDHESGKVYSWD